MDRETNYRARLYRTYATGFSDFTHKGTTSATLSKEILRHVPRDRDANILDVGCGQGELLALLEHAGYTKLRGIDISTEQVERARRRGLTARIDQEHLADHLASRRTTYHAVLAVDVLEHFDKPELVSVLDLIAAALVPGGVLVVRVPNAEGPYGARLRYGDFTHGVAFTHHSVRQVLTCVGFSHVRTFPTSPAAHGLLSLGRLCLWKILAAQRQLALTIETGVPRGHIVSQNLVAVARRDRVTAEP